MMISQDEVKRIKEETNMKKKKLISLLLATSLIGTMALTGSHTDIIRMSQSGRLRRR